MRTLEGMAEQGGWPEQGKLIAKACDLRGWTLSKLCREAGIPTSRMDRIVKGARIRYEDGLRLEDVLGLARGKLSVIYQAWSRRGL